jgi:hypothetical protein
VPVTITGFQPNSGVVQTSVTISGTGFTNNADTHVYFNDLDAPQFNVVSANQIVASVPMGASTGPIRVTNSNRAATSNGDFTVEEDAATIVTFAPRQGPPLTQVRIGGEGFEGTTRVSFNNVPAARFQVLSDSMIVAVVPQNATTGLITFSVHGAVARSPFPFTVTGNQFVRHERLDAAAANPFEAAVIAAWNALFQAGPNNLPDIIRKNYATLSVPDANGSTLPSDVDVCLVPNDPYTPIGKHPATLNLTQMSFTGIANIGQNGAPAFSNNDTQLVLPTQLTDIVVSGSFAISQTCCIPSIIGCNGDFAGHANGTFTYTLPSILMNISVSLSKDPQSGKPVVQVGSLSFTANSAPVVQIPDPLPSWLSWLNYLTGYIITSTAIKGSLSTNVANAIQGTALAGQIQTILNSVLASSANADASDAGG